MEVRNGVLNSMPGVRAAPTKVMVGTCPVLLRDGCQCSFPRGAKHSQWFSGERDEDVRRFLLYRREKSLPPFVKRLRVIGMGDFARTKPDRTTRAFLAHRLDPFRD